MSVHTLYLYVHINERYIIKVIRINHLHIPIQQLLKNTRMLILILKLYVQMINEALIQEKFHIEDDVKS